MNQITEDYCNKEISVLLREKGFDVPVKNYFSLNKDAILHNLDKQFGEKKNWNHFEYCISRPSQSIALKWLRKVYKLHISIDKASFYWNYGIYDIKNKNTDLLSVKTDFSSYEQAVEAALLFVLKNLI